MPTSFCRCVTLRLSPPPAAAEASPLAAASAISLPPRAADEPPPVRELRFANCLKQLDSRRGRKIYTRASNCFQITNYECNRAAHLVGRRFAHQLFADSRESFFLRIDSQKKMPILEALGQIRANRVFSRIRIQIRVIRVQSSLLSIFW